VKAEQREGFEAWTIGAEDGLQATFVPGAGMLCCSLRERSVELLAPRNGVRSYAERASTMGIPLLYPWANRLAGLDYPGPRGTVALRADDPLLKLDGNGLPIHGARPGALPWELLDAGADGDAEGLRARLRWEREELLAIFPWRHEVQLRASIAGATLSIETTVRAADDSPAGDAALPVAFGFHPYLSLPDRERGAWEVALPVTRQLTLDEKMIPTGESRPFERRRFVLADSVWDDAFSGLAAPRVFALSNRDAGVDLEFIEGFSWAQLYAPSGGPFVCFEPMTAPTNALRSGEALPRVDPGGAYRAAFALSVRL
jgi:aldose 1-epimerase